MLVSEVLYKTYKKPSQQLGHQNIFVASSLFLGFPGGSGVKSLPASAGPSGEADLIPGGGTGAHSRVPAGIVPWTEEPSGLQSVGPQGVRHDRATEHKLSLPLRPLI